MKLAATLALVLAPLLVVADGWHFETSSGRADGTGSHNCQRFYMKETENFTFKLDAMRSRSKRSAEPQGCSQRDHNEGRCGNGDWASYTSPQNGGWNGPATPPPQNGQPQNNGGWNGPSTPPHQNAPPQNNGGQWKGPTAAPPALRCCLKVYGDDDCKDKDNEMCVEDQSNKRDFRGKAGKDFKSFNVACS
jgi:hypothetical protein